MSSGFVDVVERVTLKTALALLMITALVVCMFLSWASLYALISGVVGATIFVGGVVGFVLLRVLLV
jgi:hypothetical protein